MKNVAVLFALVLSLLVSSHSVVAAQSTINPTQPVQGAPLTSAPVRNNFVAAYNDINNIYSFLSSGLQKAVTLTTNGTTGASTFSNNILNVPQYQGALTLTTSGSTGAATLSGNTLNIPQYAMGSFAFSGLTSGTNTTAAMLVGSGASLGATGSGTIAATTVVTNANLTGDVTSVGNATTLAASTVTGKALTGFSAGAGTVSATDSILTAFNKIVGNISALVTGVSSVSNSDSTITFSPTTGAVVGSLNLAHANTWTTGQTIASGTLTSNASALNITQTWNNSGITFDAPILVNVTNTASNAASKLIDLQTGGTTQFSVSEIGNLIIGSGSGTVASIASPTGGMSFSINSHVTFGIGQISSSVQYLCGIATDYMGFAPSTDPGANPDTMWSRKGVANMALGAADAASPIAQSFSVQNVVIGTSNTAGANFTQNMSQGTGTGAGGSYILRVAPAGTTGTSQNALVTALTIDSTRLATFAAGISAGAGSFTSISASGAIQGLNDVRAGATNYIYWNTRSSMKSPSDGVINFRNNADSADAAITAAAGTFSGLTTTNAGLYVGGSFVEAANFTANTSTSYAMNIDNGPSQILTITGAVAVTLTTPTHPGKSTIKFLEDGTGHVYSVSGCKWPGGVAITYSTAANAYDIISIWYDGTNFNCSGGAAFQ